MKKLINDLWDAFEVAMSKFDIRCPLCERAMPGHHAPDCRYLTLGDRVKEINK
jgi:hypothetical protein